MPGRVSLIRIIADRGDKRGMSSNERPSSNLLKASLKEIFAGGEEVGVTSMKHIRVGVSETVGDLLEAPVGGHSC